MVSAHSEMRGRTCLITGANRGIGKVTAVGLAEMGADLVLLCRDRKRGEAVQQEILAIAGVGNVELLVCDLGSQKQVRSAADEFLSTDRPLHVLINNAGVTFNKRSETDDGTEATFAINHLGPFLLTGLLLDRIKQSAPARIVNVSSVLHKIGGGLKFDDLNATHGYRGTRVYGRSKLANILFTRELARRLEGTGVTANSLHPGSVASDFGQNNGGLARRAIKAMAPIRKSPHHGARTSIYLASSPEVEGVSGKYFADSKEKEPSSRAKNDADAKRLWEVSAAMTLD